MITIKDKRIGLLDYAKGRPMSAMGRVPEHNPTLARVLGLMNFSAAPEQVLIFPHRGKVPRRAVWMHDQIKDGDTIIICPVAE